METQNTEPRSITPEDVCAALRAVEDPEVAMNIVDLGLIYRVEVTERAVAVDMTMTSPACPMGEMLVADVQHALKKVLPADKKLELQLVWEPPWSPALMSEKARDHFGWEV